MNGIISDSFSGKFMRAIGIDDPDTMVMGWLTDDIPKLATSFAHAGEQWDNGEYVSAAVTGGVGYSKAALSMGYIDVFSTAAGTQISNATQALAGDDGLRYLAADDDTVFSALADGGDEMIEHIDNGEPLRAIPAAAAAQGRAALEATEEVAEYGANKLREEFNNTINGGIWNNLITGLVGALSGFLVGNIAGKIFGVTTLGPFGGIGGEIGGIAGAVGGAAGGWFMGDKVMDSLGISIEPKVSSPDHEDTPDTSVALNYPISDYTHQEPQLAPALPGPQMAA